MLHTAGFMGTGDMMGNHDEGMQGELWTQGRGASAFAISIWSTGPAGCLSLDIGIDCGHWRDCQEQLATLLF